MIRINKISRKKWEFKDNPKYKDFSKSLQKEASNRGQLGGIYKNRILNFYDPVEHMGMTSEEFVDLLIDHFNTIGDKSLANWIYMNKGNQCKYVSKIVLLNQHE